MSEKYKILSPEGAQHYGNEEGAEVELNLDAREEKAVIAAGWLEPVKKKGG